MRRFLMQSEFGRGAVRRGFVSMLAALSLLGAFAAQAGAAPERDALRQRASWVVPNGVAIRERVFEWLAGVELDAARQLQIETLWPEGMTEPPGVDWLEHVAATIAVVDREALELVRVCRRYPDAPAPPEFGWLRDESRVPFVRHNMTLYYARWLAQHAYYDEAAGLLDALDIEQVVDPAGLLFYRATVQHRLLEKKACLDSLQMLLENKEALPRRYATMAELMEADLRPLEEDSLDEIARLMDDVRRRLRLARAGTRVRKQEADVIAKLDKLIKQIEQQLQQQQQAGAGAGQGGSRSQNPADDSVPLGGRGPGDVDQRSLGEDTQWGKLSPKQREEALQQISKDLPAHFRQVIEQYFRKLGQGE